jgi:hypothetical protein
MALMPYARMLYARMLYARMLYALAQGNKKRLFATTGAKGVRGATLIRYRT